MASREQIVVGTLAVASVSGLLLFVGNRAKALDKTQFEVEQAAEGGFELFDKAGDIIGQLEEPIGEVGGFVGEVGGLGSDIVGGVRTGLRLPGRAVKQIGRGVQQGGRTVKRAVRTVSKGVGRVTGGAAKIVTAPARGVGKLFGKIF